MSFLWRRLIYIWHRQLFTAFRGCDFNSKDPSSRTVFCNPVINSSGRKTSVAFSLLLPAFNKNCLQVQSICSQRWIKIVFMEKHYFLFVWGCLFFCLVVVGFFYFVFFFFFLSFSYFKIELSWKQVFDLMPGKFLRIFIYVLWMFML